MSKKFKNDFSGSFLTLGDKFLLRKINEPFDSDIRLKIYNEIINGLLSPLALVKVHLFPFPKRMCK